MKKIISMVVAAVFLTGCAQMQKFQNPLDKQGASKGVKTAEASAACAGAGAFLGKMFGGNATLAAVGGGLFCGIAEYLHETDRELKVAQEEEARMKAAYIEAKVTETTIKVTDDNGVVSEKKVLGDYFVPSTSEVAVKSISNVISKSGFPGQIVIIANTTQRASIESGLQRTVDAKAKAKKPVKVTFLDAKVYVKRGANPGISWVPAHDTQIADNGKKGGAA